MSWPNTTYPHLEVGWDDLRFPAQGINPPGLASDPSVDSTTGLLLFAGNADNLIAGVAQMPHDWLEGSPIRPHIHLIFPTSNAGKNTRWKFEYNRANNNETYENAYGSYTTLATITVANPASTATLLLPDGFGNLSMTGYRVSCCILWKLSRLASSDAADDDANACALVELDIHYQRDGLGSKQELRKR